MSRRNPNSDRRARCPHCKVIMNQRGKSHRKNCIIRNNEVGWPRETEMTRRRDNP